MDECLYVTSKVKLLLSKDASVFLSRFSVNL